MIEDESPIEAAEYLRKAVPLMVKYNIPPNPLNYAIWYTYVSKKSLELNTELEAAIEKHGKCPDFVAEALFRNVINADSVQAVDQAQEQMSDVITQLMRDVESASNQTQSYSDTLEDSLQALDKLEEEPSLSSIIKHLEVKTNDINQTTRKFQVKIDSAQREISELREALEVSQKQASTDSLTGLVNRRVLEAEVELVANATSPKASNSSAGCLIMLDIDHFKKFNDTYGHVMGDKVLQAFGKLLTVECSDNEIPARYGGEEFSIFLPSYTVEQAVKKMERLRQKIKSISLKKKQSGSVVNSITASFGVAVIEAGSDTFLDVVEKADKALYQAKNAGRDRVVVHE